MNKIRILSIDGGGIRGIIPISIIDRLVKSGAFNGDADLFAGTSTGGLISLALAKGLTPAEIKNIYLNKGKKIFADSFFDDVKDIFNLTGADYNISNLEEVLLETFGDTKLKELRSYAMVTAFQLDNESPEITKRCWQPKLFGNLPSYEFDGNVPVYKAALYTAAAPVYFPSVDGFVDGGVFASNPSVIALSEGVVHFERKPEDIVMLSISTGLSRSFIEGREHDWGLAQWMKPLFGMMMDAASFSADEICRHMLSERYHRIQPVFPVDKKISMDDVSAMDYMTSFADSVDLTETENWLKKYWF